MHAVDTKHLAVSGFSDGASYALSLAVANDLFTHALAFSPGFIAAMPTGLRGKPRVFISHGVHDRVLPVERCSRRLVPRLRQGGYEVGYREFNDAHVVPGKTVEAWWLH